MKTDSQKILLSPFFLIGLFLLLLNDFYLKAEFHNFLTGKISDFAGLFIFPLFFAAFFPKRKPAIYTSTAILFIFWKSSFSQTFIDLFNSFEFFRIGRTIDLTDLSALVILPVSFFYLNYLNDGVNKNPLRFPKRFAEIAVILFSLFAFTATSYEQDRSVWFEKKYELNMTVNEFEKRIRNTKSFEISSFEKETDSFPSNQYPNVKTDPNGYYLHFDLQKSYCESKKLRVFFNLKAMDKIYIDRFTINYWCKNPPTDEDREKLISIFESEVIEKLRQNNSQ